jgi:hypothetical protein
LRSDDLRHLQQSASPVAGAASTTGCLLAPEKVFVISATGMPDGAHLLPVFSEMSWFDTHYQKFRLVAEGGIEPPTYGL